MMCSAAAVCPMASCDPLRGFEKDECPIGALCHSSSSSRSSDKWRTDSLSLCSPQATATFTLLLSPLNRTPRTPIATSRAARAYYSDREGRFDFFSFLPVEVSLRILQLLEPQDLCRVCLVCRQWYQLSQDKVLRKRRKSYVRNQRLQFRLFKENYRHSTVTPQRSAVTRHHSTPLLSPLNVMNTRDSRSLPRPQPPASPSFLHNQYTPGPAFSVMVDHVGKLNIDGQDDNIRRCLFPTTDSPSVGQKDGRLSNVRSLPIPPKHDLKPSTGWLVGKKANKSRLRRL